MNESEEKPIKERLEQATKEQVEVLRREKVYHAKLMGLMIENIDRERKKLKEKEKLDAPNIIEFMERINNLQEDVREQMKADLSTWRSEIIDPNIVKVNEKIKQIFEMLRQDYINVFPEDSARIPFISSSSETPAMLGEVDMCLGQLKGIIYGKASKFLK